MKTSLVAASSKQTGKGSALARVPSMVRVRVTRSKYMILERNMTDDQFVAMDCSGSKRPKVAIKVRVIESPTTRARAEKAVVQLGPSWRWYQA